MRVFKSTGGIPNAERIGHISFMVGGNSVGKSLFRDYLFGDDAEKFAKAVEGKEKDVIE